MVHSDTSCVVRSPGMLGFLYSLFKLLAWAIAIFSVGVAYAYKFKNITWKDWNFLIKGIQTKRYQKETATKQRLVHEAWDRTVRKLGRDAPAVLFENKTYTVADIEDESNRVANWMVTSAGLKANDVVALFMENRPQFVSIWLGASKVGVKCALINTNLKLETLYHSIKVSECKALLFGAELNGSVSEIANELKEARIQIWSRGGAAAMGISVDAEIAAAPASYPEKSLTARAQGVMCRDSVMFIYTSGTTGKPKAAKISHSRFLTASFAFSLFGALSPRDRVYVCLPLYHSAANIVGIGMLIQRGAVIVLKKKFSRRAFWTDIRESKCTVVQYIGEVARYTLAEPPADTDNQNNVRLAMGNGMRPDVWRTWQTRFGVPKIMEFYAATEGAGALLNTEGKESAIGFISPLVSLIFPSKIFKFDQRTEELVRDPATGMCVECAPDEAGEFLMRIESIGGVPNYQGYTDEKSTNAKVMSNVCKKGDQWFRSGDLLRKDKEGFVFFVDRIGDTFRWKGENVATTQIAEVMTLCESFENAQVNVYGVEIPNNEGRCGMAAIGLDGGVAKANLAALGKHVTKQLPVYARPYFLRFVPLMDMTGTFKYKKVDLRNEGFNPAACGKDELFFLHPEQGTYQPIDAKVFAAINAGTYRF